jgi:hypothetical protein
MDFVVVSRKILIFLSVIARDWLNGWSTGQAVLRLYEKISG